MRICKPELSTQFYKDKPTMIRVMIVATHTEVREGLCTVLHLAGSLEVSGAAAGLSSAIRQAGAACPDVALVDLEMPGGEGYETIRQLARRFPGTTLIALTAHDDAATRESAARAGAVAVLVKGMELPELVNAIQEAVA